MFYVACHLIYTEFKPVRRAIEQQIKEQHKLDNDGIKGMRALPFKELIRHCLPHDEALDQVETNILLYIAGAVHLTRRKYEYKIVFEDLQENL